MFPANLRQPLNGNDDKPKKAMKTRFMFLVICFVLPVFWLLGQNQQIIPLSSGLYDEIDALYLLRGLGTPSTARPWTESEAQIILKRIEYLSLNQREQILYDRIAAKIFRPMRFFPDSAFSFDAQLDIAFEAYAHTNTDDYVVNEDWHYRYEERQPPIKLSLEMALYSWFYVFTDFALDQNRFSAKDQFRNIQDMGQGVGVATSSSAFFPWRSYAYSRRFRSNIPTETSEFDFDWPKRANFTVGGQHWNLSLARDRIQWGRGYSGNFVVDGHRDYDEYLRFTAFSDRFKYEWLNVFYPNYNHKFLMAHRLEFRFLPRLVVAVSENVMCNMDGFNPRYINPAFIYHQWYDRDNFNSLAHLELDFVPFKGYRLYTQAAFDQIQAPWENNNEPAAWGILAGIEHTRFAGSGILTLSLEGAYTTPLLYRRDLVDFITVGVSDVRRRVFFDYTGYPYGGDAMVLQFDSKYRFSETALLHSRLFGMIHGKMNFFESHNKDGLDTGLANIRERTPSGEKREHEYTFGFSLGGNYVISQPRPWLKISAWTDIAYIVKKNKLMFSETGKGKDIVYHKEGISGDFQFVVGIGFQF
jgi:hypothetical protein